MRNGLLTRSFIAAFEDGDMVKIHVKRFLSMALNEVGVIKYSVTPINFNGNIEFEPYLDAGILNEDSNYDEFPYYFLILSVITWLIAGVSIQGKSLAISNRNNTGADLS